MKFARSITALALVTTLAGCWLPPHPEPEPEPDPDPAALVITSIVIDPVCSPEVGQNCRPTVSGTVENTGDLPTAGPVTLTFTGTYNGNSLSGIQAAVPCTPSTPTLAGDGTCTFTLAEITGQPVFPHERLLTITAVATDGVISSPPATDTDLLDFPAAP